MAFEHTGAGLRLPSLTLAQRRKRRWPSLLLAVVLLLIPASTAIETQAQTANPQEISSSDVEPAFKLQSERNLVLVRVVVRDAKGAAVDNLRQEDFHLFDHGKPQTILHFSIEKPALKSAEAPKSVAKTNVEVEDQDETSTHGLHGPALRGALLRRCEHPV